jgi:hypothetical protein
MRQLDARTAKSVLYVLASQLSYAHASANVSRESGRRGRSPRFESAHGAVATVRATASTYLRIGSDVSTRSTIGRSRPQSVN